MKIHTILALASLAFTAAPVLAHGGHVQGSGLPAAYSTAVQEPTAPEVRDAAKKYTCPMHPDVTSDKPGKCPKCGMNLVPAK